MNDAYLFGVIKEKGLLQDFKTGGSFDSSDGVQLIWYFWVIVSSESSSLSRLVKYASAVVGSIFSYINYY